MITLVLNLVGTGFLVASAFNANPKRMNSMGIGLSILAIANLLVPAL